MEVTAGASLTNSVGVAGMRPVIKRLCAPPWSEKSWHTERTSVKRSATLACRGKSSQISMPGTLVRMGRKSPRNSDGASGFMS